VILLSFAVLPAAFLLLHLLSVCFGENCLISIGRMSSGARFNCIQQVIMMMHEVGGQRSREMSLKSCDEWCQSFPTFVQSVSS